MVIRYKVLSNDKLAIADIHFAQIHLVIGDYFKSGVNVLDYADLANALITWLQSKTLVLALLQNAQLETTGRALAVIRAVLTRWTAHYQAYRHLLKLQPTLQLWVSAEAAQPESKKMIVMGDKKAKEHATEMLDVITKSRFWHAIAW